MIKALSLSSGRRGESRGALSVFTKGSAWIRPYRCSIPSRGFYSITPSCGSQSLFFVPVDDTNEGGRGRGGRRGGGVRWVLPRKFSTPPSSSSSIDMTADSHHNHNGNFTEKQRSHILRVAKDRVYRVVRQRSRRRSQASQALVSLLTMSPSMYRNTMAALDLDTSQPDPADLWHPKKKHSRKARRLSHNDHPRQHQDVLSSLPGTDLMGLSHEYGLNRHYRRVYQQSVPYFVALLRTQGSSSSAFSEGSSSSSLELSYQSLSPSKSTSTSTSPSPFWIFPEDQSSSSSRSMNLDTALAEKSTEELVQLLADTDSIEEFVEQWSMAMPNNSNNTCQVLLQKLVDCGFANHRFAREYRKMLHNRAEAIRIRTQIQRRQQVLEKRRANLELATDELDRLIQERFVQNRSRPQEKQQQQQQQQGEENTNSLSTQKGMLQIVSNFLSTPWWSSEEKTSASKPNSNSNKTNTNSDATYKLNSKIRFVENKIRDAERMVQRAREHKSKLERTLDYLEEEHPLSTEEYEKARAVVSEVFEALCQPLANYMHRRHAGLIEQYQVLDGMTDLSVPHQWYPLTRRKRRKIVFHGGPTNSGKTYCALERLIEAPGGGLYLGPLRLLAAEVYETLTARGLKCNLFTGQESVETPDATHSSATVELGPTNHPTQEFDVVVVDEIQMIADPFRGFAWTRVLQGIRAKELHVCGGMEALDMVRSIVHNCGDDLEVRDHYQRFMELTVADISLEEEHFNHPDLHDDANDHNENDNDDNDGKFSYKYTVQKGDCIVAFSRNDIFAIKREIEKFTDHKCSVIYGSLPPEIRVRQAQRFNDPHSDHTVLVASDAIGMGLNLNIKRIIFHSIYKSDGEKIVRLNHSSIKQISGRAGRRNSPYPNGIVTSRHPDDLAYIRTCLESEIPTIDAAGLLPSASRIQSFSEALVRLGIDEIRPTHTNTNTHTHTNTNSSTTALDGESTSNDGGLDVNLYAILQKFSEMATLQGDYFLCRQTPILRIAKYLDAVPLSVSDKYTFCMTPVNTDNHYQMQALKQYAYSLSRGEVSSLCLSSAASILDDPSSSPPQSFDDIGRLCSIHDEIELYTWLCHKYPEHFKLDQHVLAMQDRTISLINEGLIHSDQLHLNHSYLSRDVRLRNHYRDRLEKEASETPAEFIHHTTEDDEEEKD